MIGVAGKPVIFDDILRAVAPVDSSLPDRNRIADRGVDAQGDPRSEVVPAADVGAFGKINLRGDDACRRVDNIDVRVEDNGRLLMRVILDDVRTGCQA